MDGQGQGGLFCVFYHNRSIIHRLEYFILVFCYSLEEKKKGSFQNTFSARQSTILTNSVESQAMNVRRAPYLVCQELPLAGQVFGSPTQ